MEIEGGDTRKQETARKRWKILAQVLRGGTCEDIADNGVSVRRFQSFGLLSTTPVDVENDECMPRGQWYTYTSERVPQMSMKIRHLDSSVSAERLNGFNNTGNVCVWPSEEVMTFYCMKHVERFKDQKVCELGGGMTCLAGIALGLYSEASHIEVTDGNEESVQNLHTIITANNFGTTNMASRVIRWGETEPDDDVCGAFDTVICADCLFFDEGRESLAALMHDLLKPGGTALIFAPARGKTFNAFSEIAKAKFEVTVEENYDAHLWDLHSQQKSKDPNGQTYDVNLHYPLLMILKKAHVRDITPESR